MQKHQKPVQDREPDRQTDRQPAYNSQLDSYGKAVQICYVII